jgi:hypothetical protein
LESTAKLAIPFELSPVCSWLLVVEIALGAGEDVPPLSEEANGEAGVDGTSPFTPSVASVCGSMQGTWFFFRIHFLATETFRLRQNFLTCP